MANASYEVTLKSEDYGLIRLMNHHYERNNISGVDFSERECIQRLSSYDFDGTAVNVREHTAVRRNRLTLVNFVDVVGKDHESIGKLVSQLGRDLDVKFRELKGK